MRPQMAAGLAIDQAQDQPGLPAIVPDAAGEMIARRGLLAADRNAGASQRRGELIGDGAGGLVVFGLGLDRTDRQARAVGPECRQLKTRCDGVEEQRLALQRLRRRLAVAAAVL